MWETPVVPGRFKAEVVCAGSSPPCCDLSPPPTPSFSLFYHMLSVFIHWLVQIYTFSLIETLVPG